MSTNTLDQKTFVFWDQYFCPQTIFVGTILLKQQLPVLEYHPNVIVDRTPSSKPRRPFLENILKKIEPRINFSKMRIWKNGPRAPFGKIWKKIEPRAKRGENFG